MSSIATGLVLALRDKRSWVRESAVRTVEEIAPQLEAQRLLEEILKALTPLVEDEEEAVRANAKDAVEILRAYRRGSVAAD